MILFYSIINLYNQSLTTSSRWLPNSSYLTAVKCSGKEKLWGEFCNCIKVFLLKKRVTEKSEGYWTERTSSAFLDLCFILSSATYCVSDHGKLDLIICQMRMRIPVPPLQCLETGNWHITLLL